MPYSPGITDHSDQIIMQGGQQLSSALLQAIQENKKNQQDAAFSDAVMHHLAETPNPVTGQPYVPLAALNDYQQQPLKKKVGTALAAQAAAAADTSRALQEQQRQIQQGTLDLARQKFADDNKDFTPRDYWNGGTHMVEVRPNEFQVDPTQGADGAAAAEIKIDPYIEPTTKKPVAGMGIVHGPGNQFQVVNTQDQTQGPITDPTGKYQYRGPKLGWVPLPGATLVLPGVNQGGAGEAQPSGTFNVSADQSSAPGPAATAPTSPPSALATPKIQSQAEFDALPSGAVFVAPDGSKRRKP